MPTSIPETKTFTRRERFPRQCRTNRATRICATAEQEFFLKAIREDLDLSESMAAAVNSLRIVLAAEQSIQEERAVTLD